VLGLPPTPKNKLGPGATPKLKSSWAYFTWWSFLDLLNLGFQGILSPLNLYLSN